MTRCGAEGLLAVMTAETAVEPTSLGLGTETVLSA